MNVLGRRTLMLAWTAMAALIFMTAIGGGKECFAAEEGTPAKEKLLEQFAPREPSKPLIAADVAVKNFFSPGEGPEVGRAQQVMGTVYVIHEGEKTAYLMSKDKPLFAGDTLITRKQSRINALMQDKSMIALAPMTRMGISKSRYSAAKDSRSTVMDLVWGSARFIVKRLTGDSEFKVHTPTAVCGVRGTDFAVSITPAPEAEKAGFLKKLFSLLDPVREAHAFPPGALLTTALTGSASSVSFSGMVGTSVVIGPTSIAGALGGAAAGGLSFIGPVAAMGVLNAVGPGLALLDMPPNMEQ